METVVEKTTLKTVEEMTKGVKFPVTFVLLDSLDNNASIYQQIGNGKKVQVTKLPNWKPYLQTTFTDSEGMGRTVRYKEQSRWIYQDEQIKDGIPANAPFTSSERDARSFKNGVNVVRSKQLYAFLTNIPAMEGFDGYSSDYPAPCYKVFDPVADTDSLNSSLRKRVEAASYVFSLSLDELHTLLFKLKGSFYTVSNDIKECQNQLIDILDDADDKFLDLFLSKENTVDEEVSILIGKLLSKDLLSFHKETGKISLKKNDKWIAVRDISNDYTDEERKRYFIEFLTSPSGSALLDDLRKTLSGKPKVEAKEESKEEVVTKPAKPNSKP